MPFIRKLICILSKIVNKNIYLGIILSIVKDCQGPKPQSNSSQINEGGGGTHRLG